MAHKFGRATVSLAATQAFYDAVVEFRKVHGHAPHPGTIVQMFGRDINSWPALPYATHLPKVAD